MSATHTTSNGGEQRWLGDLAPRVYRPAAIVGIAGLAVAAVAGFSSGGAERFYPAYLVNLCYVLSLSLGALFFVLLQHLTRSGWSVVVRRIAEILAANMPLVAALALLIVPGLRHLYHWMHDDAVTQDALFAWKRPYLNVPFFLARCIVFFALWTLLGRHYLRLSTEQDASGDLDLTARMERLSGPGIVVFALTLTFAAFDLIMSIDAHWFSTIFGVYFFAGSLVGFFAIATLLAMGLQAAGRLRESITTEHYHDLGKLLFGFTVFWAYIAFSQYMLIWYANIPEETGWYLARQTGGWRAVAVALLLAHFVLPFCGLISRRAKRSRKTLAFWAAWLLVFHWVDLYWLIVPGLHPERPPFGITEVACLIGVGGVFVAGLVRLAAARSLVPERDPRLEESLAFENV